MIARILYPVLLLSILIIIGPVTPVKDEIVRHNLSGECYIIQYLEAKFSLAAPRPEKDVGELVHCLVYFMASPGSATSPPPTLSPQRTLYDRAVSRPSSRSSNRSARAPSPSLALDDPVASSIALDVAMC
jgi:hypothetical protein